MHEKPACAELGGVSEEFEKGGGRADKLPEWASEAEGCPAKEGARAACLSYAA